MRVVCDSCGATYKIPDTKLVKDVNRATCRKCGHRMLIRKPDGSAAASSGYPLAPTEEERTVIASASDLERRAREHLAAAQAATGTRLGARPPQAEEDPTIVKTLAAVQGGSGISVGRPRGNEIPVAPARVQRHPTEEMTTIGGPSIERMPERHVSQALGPAQPITPAPRVEPAAGFDHSADAARKSVGRQAVVIDQVMRPPVPVAPDPRSFPPHSAFGQHPNGGAGAAMPAPATPVAAPPKRSSMSGLIVAVVLLVLLSTIGAAAYVWRQTPVESPERVDKVTTEAPAADAAPVEEAPTEVPSEEPTADAAPSEPEPAAAEVAEVEPLPAPVPVEKPEPTRSTSRSASSSSSSKSTSRSSGSTSKPTTTVPTSNAIEIPDTPPSTAKTVAPKPSTKPSEPEVSDADLLGDPAPAKSTAKTVAPPPVPDEPAAEVLDTLPLTVLDTIVRNNKNIKRCFFNEQQKTGVLPSVSVKMKIETNGSVSAASVAEPAAQQGTDLDACLASAFKGLQFPAFKTPMGAVTYPFKF